MNNNYNRDIYDYASELNSNCLTFYDVFFTLLSGINCVICRESAADLLGYSNGGYRSTVTIYTEKFIDKPYLNCIIVDNLDNISSIDYRGLKVTPIAVAIIDMLQNNSTDDQILYETFANYYCDNHNTYSNLKVPKQLEKKFELFKMEGRRFYES